MNRSRRTPQNRTFVSGGIYNPSFNNQQGNNSDQQQGYQSTQVQQNENAAEVKKSIMKQQRQQPTPPLQPPPQPPRMDDEEPMEVKAEETALYDETGKLQYKNIFRTRKKSSVRAKEKKIRQNRQLRKTLIPKNALMALNEVVGLTISEFIITSSTGGGFVAVVSVNDKQYEGKGNSKMAAKNNASEKALRDYVLEKMREKPRLRKISTNNDEALDTSDMQPNNEEPSENGDDGQQDNVSNSGATPAFDDVPMVNLASFAIYKLFTEWENEGYAVPELRVAHPIQPGSGTDTETSPQPKIPKAPPVRSELPHNWETIHPSTLLCMMRPGLQYRELGTMGDAPNVLQRMGVTVDDVNYESSGRSKKTARRNVAVCVLNELFGTNFTKEEPCAD
uniref:Double-stranded RNA-specific editase 1 n=1 Tax=Ceratitis capitata TaxID=7213 RepID=W8BCT8_CERCA